jgi:hypothetical protein
MNKQVRALKVSLSDIIESNPIDYVGNQFVTPNAASVLSMNAGTLIEAEEGGLYLVPVAEWFRSSYYGKALPQVSEFNKLQDLGLTAIKDKIVRKAEHGQEIRSQDNVGAKKADEAMASDSSGETKD